MAINVPSIDQVVSALWKRIPRSAVAAVLTAAIFGFILHIAEITGFAVNWDSFIIYSPTKFVVGQGKWFYYCLQQLRGVLNIDSLSGPIAIAMLAINAGLITALFRVRGIVSGVCIGAVTVAMPAVMCTFAYSEDVFFTALVLSTVAVFIIRRGGIWNTLIGICLLTLQLGTYQAYISNAAGLFVLLCLFDALDGKKTVRDIVKQGIGYICVLIVSIVLYYLVLTIVVKQMDISLSQYHGANNMYEQLLNDFAGNIISAYKRVVYFFLYDELGSGERRFVWLYRATLLSGMASFAFVTYIKGIYKDFGRICLTSAMIFIFPLAINAIDVLDGTQDCHWLMIYAFTLVFIAVIKLADMCVEMHDNKKTKKIKCTAIGALLQWMAISICICLVFSWYVLTNQGYMRMKLAYEATYNIITQINDDITKCPNYSEDAPVALCGLAQYLTKPDDFEKMNQFTGIAKNGFVFSYDGSMLAETMMEDYLNVRYNYVSQTKENEIKSMEEYQTMPSFPMNGSTKMIDGVIVVKLEQ